MVNYMPDLDGVYYGEIGRLWNNELRQRKWLLRQELMEEVMAQPNDVLVFEIQENNHMEQNRAGFYP
jgi:hypothetical protein